MLDFIKKYKFEILLIMFTLLIMLIYDENGFLYNFTNYPDVKIYYNIGKRLIFGKQLYIDLIDVKGPYMFFIGALSYLLNKDMTMFFIIDCVFMLIYSIYTYKIFKLYVNELTSFISTICINMLIFPKFEYFGNFEVMLIGINTIFIHWILNDGFKKKNNKLFFVFGIFISLILLIKLNYLFSFGIIGLIYLFTSIKNKKKIKKELLSMFGGFLVGCTPLFIYDIIHKSYFLTIIRYIFFCFNYGNNKFMINLSLYQLLKLFILFVFIVFSFFIINILNNKNIKLVFLFFLCSIFDTLITKNIYYYYLYIVFPFISFIFIAFFLLEIKIKKHNFFIVFPIKQLILIMIVFIFMIQSYIIPNNKNILQSIQLDYEYKFYEKYKDVITEDTLILSIGHIDNIICSYFDNQPNTPYWAHINISYENWPELYEYQINSMKNKKVDYLISTGFFIEKYSTMNKYYNHIINPIIYKYKFYTNKNSTILFGEVDSTNPEYVHNFFNELNLNYKKTDVYIKKNLLYNFVFYFVYQPSKPYDIKNPI